MKSINSQKGQALVLIALAIVGLVGFSALAIDGGRVLSDRRHAQNAADTAAFAAALAKIKAQPPETADVAAEAAGLERAASNGFDNINSVVEVNSCAVPGLDPPCEALPTGADPLEYIQVVIRLTTKTTFARIIGRTEVQSMVTAVARAKIGGEEPIGAGAAISAMSPHDENAVFGHGNFTLDIINSGIFDNSDHGCAFTTSGSSGSYSVDTAFAVVGGHCQNGLPTLNGPVESASQIPYPPALNIPVPSIACSGNSILDGVTRTYSPGNHIDLNIPNGTYTFAPGNHCFHGGVRVNGNTNLIANDANFLITSGEFRDQANGTFTCNNLLVHINGGSGFHVNGNSTNNCTGVTFFASTGDVTWNGNPTINFTAPTSGPYKGLLIYLPHGNSSTLTINGNSQQSLTGSIIAVSSPIQVNGNSGTFALSSQIIGYTVSLSGNGNIVINYDPDQQYAQDEPTLIQLTK